MFSLHIDTARTWRGGQNQVLLTVNGLREIGHRAALVAHPDGELRRRAAEGLELIPLAPRTEMDLSAAWRLARVHQAAAAGRRPRARCARRGDGVARAVARRDRRPGARRSSPRAASTSTCARTRFRAGNIARWTASSPPRRRSGRCWWPTACRRIGRSPFTKASTSTTCARRRRSTCTRRSGCPTRRRSSATSPRSSRTRASAI